MLDNYTCVEHRDSPPPLQTETLAHPPCTYMHRQGVDNGKGVRVFQFAGSKSSQLSCLLNIQISVTVILHHYNNKVHSNSLV